MTATTLALAASLHVGAMAVLFLVLITGVGFGSVSLTTFMLPQESFEVALPY